MSRSSRKGESSAWEVLPKDSERLGLTVKPMGVDFELPPVPQENQNSVASTKPAVDIRPLQGDRDVDPEDSQRLDVENQGESPIYPTMIVIEALVEERQIPEYANYQESLSMTEKWFESKCERRIVEFAELQAIKNSKVFFSAVLEWIARATCDTSYSEHAMCVNTAACTYLRALEQDSEAQSMEDIEFAIPACENLVFQMQSKAQEFRRRNPTSYRRESYWKSLFPEIDHGRLYLNVSSYYQRKHLYSNMARTKSIKLMLSQITFWAVCALVKFIFAGVTVHTLQSLVALIYFGLMLIVSVAVCYCCCSKKPWFGEKVLRSLGFFYVFIWAMAGSIADLAYLFAPILLLTCCYIINDKLIKVNQYQTYVVGLIFTLVTLVIYGFASPVSMINLMLWFYVYNSWMAIQLDFAIQKVLMFRKKEATADLLDPNQFLNSYLAIHMLVFHLLAPVLAFGLAYCLSAAAALIMAACVGCCCECGNKARQREKALAEKLSRLEYCKTFGLEPKESDLSPYTGDHVSDIRVEEIVTPLTHLFTAAGIIIVFIFYPFPNVPWFKVETGSAPKLTEDNLRLREQKIEELRMFSVIINIGYNLDPALAIPDENPILPNRPN